MKYVGYSGDHVSWIVNGDYVKVSNLIEMFSKTTLVKRMNVQVLEPQGVNERLNP
jgi:hypothetical protein